MTPNTIVFSAFILFAAMSVLYVFKFRGNTRYENFTEYVRKGWPMFAPINCWLYLFTNKKAAKPIIKIEDFPELKIIQDNWKTICEEASALRNLGFFDQTTKPENAAYYDIGFRTFYKYGWSKFYINWYGHTHHSAKKYCPKTTELLSKISSVKGAMFSLLPAGSQLTRHLDPAASSLRFHLGLDTPNSDACFINVDGQTQSWRNGEAFLFDETFLHFVKNNTDKSRLILMCDIERPVSIPGMLINKVYQALLYFTVVPNQPGDKEGLVNKIFSSVTPLMQKVRTLKQTNLALYKVIKHSVNGAILVTLIMIASSVIKFITSLVA